ncbi:hypothetical protein HOY80DRAFT_1000839 [Tuber brumale]|nr:hypothetical protein HOY80DRAFT_1000839 [Tuber brumale]
MFGKGKYRGMMGGDFDSNSDDEHHHHHHHRHGMGMDRRHDRKDGYPHHDDHRHDWSHIDDECSFGPPRGPPMPSFGGSHHGFGGPPRPYGGGTGKYGHSEHQFVDRVRGSFKDHKNGRPSKSFGSHGSGDGWKGRGNKFSSVSGPWDRYQAHGSFREYSHDGDFFPSAEAFFEIFKEFTRVPLGDPKGKSPHPPPPAPTRPRQKKTIPMTCKDPGMVQTFNDGPFQYTTELLDILKKNGGIRATFFVNGRNAGDLNDQATKDTLKRIMEDGHQIGSHTLDTHDWKNMGNMQVSKDIVNKAVDGADSKKNNFIVLAHDIYEATVEQLAKHMIDQFKEKGYRCKRPPRDIHRIQNRSLTTT